MSVNVEFPGSEDEAPSGDDSVEDSSLAVEDRDGLPFPECSLELGSDEDESADVPSLDPPPDGEVVVVLVADELSPVAEVEGPADDVSVVEISLAGVDGDGAPLLGSLSEDGSEHPKASDSVPEHSSVDGGLDISHDESSPVGEVEPPPSGEPSGGESGPASVDVDPAPGSGALDVSGEHDSDSSGVPLSYGDLHGDEPPELGEDEVSPPCEFELPAAEDSSVDSSSADPDGDPGPALVGSFEDGSFDGELADSVEEDPLVEGEVLGLSPDDPASPEGPLEPPVAVVPVPDGSGTDPDPDVLPSPGASSVDDSSEDEPAESVVVGLAVESVDDVLPEDESSPPGPVEAEAVDSLPVKGGSSSLHVDEAPGFSALSVPDSEDVESLADVVLLGVPLGHVVPPSVVNADPGSVFGEVEPPAEESSVGDSSLAGEDGEGLPLVGSSAVPGPDDGELAPPPSLDGLSDLDLGTGPGLVASSGEGDPPPEVPAEESSGSSGVDESVEVVDLVEGGDRSSSDSDGDSDESESGELSESEDVGVDSSASDSGDDELGVVLSEPPGEGDPAPLPVVEPLGVESLLAEVD